MIFHQPGNSRGNFHYNALTYSGKEYAPHFHKNMELILVQTGTMQVTVNGETQKLSAGQGAMILSNQIHSFSVPEGAACWVAVFSEDFVPYFSSLIKSKQGSTFLFEPTPAVAALIRSNLVNGDCSRLMQKACFYAVCDNYLQQVELEPRQEKSSFLVGQLLDWIAQHYTEDISLKQAAEAFGYEYHYLSRLLNRNFAISFTGILAAYRVEHAVQLLQTTDLSITQIAERSGFQSIRGFNLSFRKITGKTPMDYRVAH